jgi:UDP-glucose 4-epimerase
MRALVTGGAGFIGTRLHTVLLDAGHEVLILDDLRFGHVMPLPMDMLHVVIDSLGSKAAADAIRDFEPTVVFHAAAIQHRPYTEEHPQESVRVNVDGSRWLLKVCDELPELEAVIACSTAAVYGFADEVITEDAPIAPRGVYGESKLRMERSMRRFSAAHPRVCVAAARLFSVYGPGSRTPHVMPALMEQIWRSEPLRVGNTWPKRDYVHVYDVAEALVRLARWRPGFWAYNVGTGVGTSVGQLIGRLAWIAGVSGVHESDPALMRVDDGHLVSDPSRIITSTGWRPRIELTDGLAWLAQDTMATSATG